MLAGRITIGICTLIVFLSVVQIVPWAALMVYAASVIDAYCLAKSPRRPPGG